MASGERFPLVIENSRGRPLFDVAAFLLRERRPDGLQFNTLKAHAEAIRFFLTWAALRAIDLEPRLSSGELLSFDEVEALYGDARLGFEGLAEGVQSRTPKRAKAPSPERIIRHSRPSLPGVEPSVAGTRLRYIADYLDWTVKTRCAKAWGGKPARSLGLDPTEIGALLRARAPKKQSRNPDHEREGLPEEDQAVLLAAIAADSPANPFDHAFVRDRNELIVLLFYHLGLRQGELLKLKITAAHFNAQKRVLNVTRSPDDPTDARTDPPQAKTNARALELSDHLTKRILDHIVKHRRLRRYAASHSFLFVSQSGNPLSKSAISKIFATIRGKIDELGDDLTPHQLRHTFNENLSAMFDASGTTDENERRARSYLNGWSPGSETAATYLRRRTRTKAQELGVKLQEKLKKGPDRE
jgi:integrase